MVARDSDRDLTTYGGYLAARPGVLPDDEVSNPARGCVYAVLFAVAAPLSLYGAISLALDIAAVVAGLVAR
jgi:hypothetical protein